MLSHAHAATQYPDVPPCTISRPADPGVEPIDWIGPFRDEDRVLVLGGYGSELMCALVRAGAGNVTHLRLRERPEPHSASLVIVPHVPSLDWLATALPSIRRSLVADGRLVVRGGTQFNFLIEARRMLTLNGFTAIRSDRNADSQTLAATVRESGIHQTI